MKIYDKKMYKTAEKIKTAIFILLLFTISFILGYKVCDCESQKVIEEKQRRIEEQYIELDSLRETVYMYQIYGN